VSSTHVLELVVTICCVWHALHSGELIAAHKRKKLLLIHLVRSQDTSAPTWCRPLTSPVVFVVATYVRFASAIVTALSLLVGEFVWPVLALLCVTSYYYSWYRPVGGDGSEDMGLVVLVASTFSSGPLCSEACVVAALYFIGAQCLLAYFVAGVSKLASRTWRTGVAVERIIATEAFGLPAFHRTIQSHPSVGRLLTWSSLTFEIALPPAVLVWGGAAIALVAAGFLFHCSCAWIMGLNGFPVSFGATYPAVLFMSEHLHRSNLG
jgi:hypothetical protein